MRLLPRALRLTALFVFSLSGRVIAHPVAEADLLWNTYNFTSPGDAYGARNSQELRTRLHLASDSPGIDVLNQNDANRVSPQHGQYIVVDDYHQFKGGSFGYLSLGAGSGNTVPLHNLYAEGDLKVLRSAPLVLGVGGDVTTNANGVVERYASVGPTYYFKNGDTTLRFMPTSISGGSAAPSGEFSFQLWPDTPRDMTLVVQVGNAPPFLAQEGSIALGGGQRAIDLNLTFKRPIRRHFSLVYGLDFTHVTDATSGNALYTRRGVSIGLARFFDPKSGK